MCGHLYVYVCVLGVEGKDTLVVSSDQQQRWEVFGQSFQPAHVEGARHRSLSGQRQTPTDTHREIYVHIEDRMKIITENIQFANILFIITHPGL